jgi:autophagy-related protein 18
VLIFDTLNLSAVNVIQAHKTPIAALALNATGTVLATASDKGTVVRVFSVPDAKKLWQFRRGSSSAHIFSMNFNLTSTLLAVSSDTSTIHIYRLTGGQKMNNGDDTNPSPPASASSTTTGFDDGPQGPPPNLLAPPHSAASSLRRRSYHLGKSLLGNAGTYLPKGVTEMWEPQRDFAHIKVRSAQTGVRTVVAMSPTLPQVMVLSADGVFQAYNIDLENGGECALLKEFK